MEYEQARQIRRPNALKCGRAPSPNKISLRGRPRKRPKEAGPKRPRGRPRVYDYDGVGRVRPMDANRAAAKLYRQRANSFTPTDQQRAYAANLVLQYDYWLSLVQRNRHPIPPDRALHLLIYGDASEPEAVRSKITRLRRKIDQISLILAENNESWDKFLRTCFQ